MYDEKGNYDYEAAAAQRHFRPNGIARLSERLKSGTKTTTQAVGCILVVLALGGAFVGCAYTIFYGAGRAVGSGMHDGRTP